MKKQKIKLKIGTIIGGLCFLLNSPFLKTIEAAQIGANHIGTLEGTTVFKALGSNGVNPGLLVEVIDDEGKRTQYKSADGIIRIPDTKEGTYVTQAKFLGKTKYIDQETGEILDQWAADRHLKLISVENPFLETTKFSKVLGNRELVNIYNSMGYVNVHAKLSDNEKFVLTGDGMWGNPNKVWNLEPHTTYTAVVKGEATFSNIWTYGMKDVSRGTFSEGFFVKFTTDDTGNFGFILNFSKNVEVDFSVFYGDVVGHLEELDKKDFLTFNEHITLRGIENTNDELDLLTGKVTKKIEEVLFCGNDEENWSYDTQMTQHYKFLAPLKNNVYTAGKMTLNVLGDLYPTLNNGHTTGGSDVESLAINGHVKGQLNLSINKNKLAQGTVNLLKEFLKKNPLTVQYELSLPEVTMSSFKTTRSFPLLNKTFLQIEGSIPPIITSITIPTNELSFALDPNQEAGHQFIAPAFEVTNDSNAPLSLNLKTFEQTTNVFNDVLPSKYSSWNELTKEQSKDIALGLVAQSSDDWLTVVEEPHYVSETTNKLLGTIKPKGTVGFKFVAHHGQAFNEVLSPSYRLTLVFDLLQ